MSGLQVRPAQADDGPAVYAAWQSLRHYYASVDRRIINAPVALDDFVDAYRERFGQGTAAAFVAVDGRRLAGFIICTIEHNQPDRLPERHATVGHLFVDPDYRRKGIGRKLFESVAGWATAQDNVSHFEMPVLAADSSAAEFWRALGFTPFIQRLWAPLSAPELDG